MITLHEVGSTDTYKWGWLILKDGRQIPITSGAVLTLAFNFLRLQTQEEVEFYPYTSFSRLRLGPPITSDLLREVDDG